MLFSFLFFCDGFFVEKMPTSSAVHSRFVLLSLIRLMGFADKRLWGLPLSAEALLRCYPLSWIISPGTTMLSLILLCSYFEVPVTKCVLQSVLFAISGVGNQFLQWMGMGRKHGLGCGSISIDLCFLAGGTQGDRCRINKVPPLQNAPRFVSFLDRW